MRASKVCTQEQWPARQRTRILEHKGHTRRAGLDHDGTTSIGTDILFCAMLKCAPPHMLPTLLVLAFLIVAAVVVVIGFCCLSKRSAQLGAKSQRAYSGLFAWPTMASLRREVLRLRQQEQQRRGNKVSASGKQVTAAAEEVPIKDMVLRLRSRLCARCRVCSCSQLACEFDPPAFCVVLVGA